LAVELEDAVQGISPEAGDAFIDGLPVEESSQLIDGIQTAQVDAMSSAVSWTTWFVVIGIFIATFLPGRRKRQEKLEPAPRGELY
jgi:hypothetical protein